jgi:magnesium-dependent phosphatase 1
MMPTRRTFQHFAISISIIAMSEAAFSMGKGSSSDQRVFQSTCPANKSEINTDLLPSLIIFDLDDCLWTPEMHELSGMPSKPIEGPLDPNNPSDSPLGTIGMGVPKGKRGGWGGYNDEEEIVELYHGARLALRELVTNHEYRNIKIGVASTSLEPSYSRACIAGIEITEGVFLKDIISFTQIGRSGKLTSRKTSHFELIHEESGVPYDDMLWYDDCNWGDHVGDLNKAFGVIGVRTPHGLTLEKFHEGLQLFNREKRKRFNTES